MNKQATKLYDRATDTVRDWAGTVRDELPDMADVKDAAEGVTEWAGDWVGDTAGKLANLMPGVAAQAAARARRRRWIFGGVAAAVLAVLFGPGGAQRRAAMKERWSDWFGGSRGTTNPSFSNPGYSADATGTNQQPAGL